MIDRSPFSGSEQGRTSASVIEKDALRFLGYSGQSVDDALMERFDEIARDAESTLLVSYVWRAFPIDQKATRWQSAEGEGEPVIALSGTSATLRGRNVNRHLDGASTVVLMACTLGAAFEREQRRTSALSSTDALMFDACASSLVDVGADIVNAQVDQEAIALGFTTGKRFSPGYGDFSLDEQSDFASALNLGRTLGITVTPEHMLIPSKSITATIGVFDTACDGPANDRDRHGRDGRMAKSGR